ncbi:hypothetical protein HKX48_008871 [Thoreauomyces humboldtii]|nr:hypothetical protein HKX48_008871 [Thoreauomyces humboldtii]
MQFASNPLIEDPLRNHHSHQHFPLPNNGLGGSSIAASSPHPGAHFDAPNNVHASMTASPPFQNHDDDDDDDDEEGETELSALEDTETSVEGLDRFFRSLLRTCLTGFRSIVPAHQTDEVRRGILAVELGLDYLEALANKADLQAAEGIRKAQESAEGASSVACREKAATIGGTLTTKVVRRSVRLPTEILFRIFNYACCSKASGSVAPSRQVQRTLYSCSLVAKDWSRPANAVLWRRINMQDQPARFGRFVLGSATSKYNKRDSAATTRVLTVGCTDQDLSLLSVACHHTSGLHSLELNRTRDLEASSYRLLQRLPNRFPSLRSLVADNIPPSAWRDMVRLCSTCPLLSNLHISFAAVMGGDKAVDTPVAADFEELFSGTPFLHSLSLWRVPIPPEEDAIVRSLSTHCKNLKAIRVDDCGTELTMGLFQSLWNQCSQLQCITLRMIRYPPPPRDYPVHLDPLPTLRTLLIDGCWLSDDLLECIGRSSPNLETLYMEDDWRDGSGSGEVGSVVHVTDRGILSMAPHLRNLRTLSLVGLVGGDHPGPTARSVRTLASYNRNLTALNLARPDHALSSMDDASLLHLAPAFAHIRRLELYMQYNISEDALAQTLADAPRLVSLGLSGCAQVLTDATVAALPLLCPFIERVDMAGAVNCSDLGIQRLVDGAVHLRECVLDCGQGESVRWGDVINFDDPWSEEVFSPYSVWEREGVGRCAAIAGFIY